MAGIRSQRSTTALILAALFHCPAVAGDNIELWSTAFVAGETATVESSGAYPGDISVILCDVEPGDFDLPGGAWLGLGMTPAFHLVDVRAVRDEETVRVDVEVPADDHWIGRNMYFQTVVLQRTGLLSSNRIDQTIEAPQSKAFRIVVTTDNHLQDRNPAKPSRGLLELAEFLRRVPETGADMVLHAGDMIDYLEGAPIVEAVVREAQEMHGTPPVHLVSNDHHDWFGRGYYSFDHKGVHFITYSHHRGALDDPDHTWLAEDIAAVPDGTPIVYMQHQEVGATYSSKKALLSQHHPFPVLALHGHYHVERQHQLSDSRRAVDHIRELCMQPFSKGFYVADFAENGEVHIDRRELGFDRVLDPIHPAAGSQIDRSDRRIVVRAFDTYRDVVSVEFDSGAGWEPMARSTHRQWVGRANLGSGVLRYRALDTNGEEWRNEVQFEVLGTDTDVQLGADWPVFGGGTANRRSSQTGPRPPLQLAWYAPLGRVELAAPVLSDGRLLTTGYSHARLEDNFIACVDAVNGSVLWRVQLASGPFGTPAVAAGRVACLDVLRHVRGFELASGNEAWPAATGPYGGGPFVTANDHAFFFSGVLALDANDGSELWQTGKSSEPLVGHLAVSDGFLLGPGPRNFDGGCARISDGSIEWTDAGLSGKVAMLPGGFLSGRTMLREGVGGLETVWTADVPSEDGSWAVGEELAVFASDGTLYGISLSDGSRRWTLAGSGSATFSEPAVGGSMVYVTDSAGNLRIVELNSGALLEERRLGGPLSAPAVSGNTVFVCGSGGSVFAFTGAR